MNIKSVNGEFFPQWDSIPEWAWREIMERFFFKLANRFGFSEVSLKKDLFPKGLNYFEDWDLKEIDLIDVHGKTVCQFDLGQSQKELILAGDFSVHEKGMIPPRSYWEFDEHHYYYEFDELHFFRDDIRLGTFINHEDMITFESFDERESQLSTLSENVKDLILESERINRIFNGR